VMSDGRYGRQQKQRASSDNGKSRLH